MSVSEPDETYLTVAEVAEKLKLNQQTVRNWIDQGSLPALRVGRRVRIKRSDFERILEQSYSGSTGLSGAASGPNADDFWGGEPVGLAERAQRTSESDRPRRSGADGPRRAEADSTGRSQAGRTASDDPPDGGGQ